ncbi:hypothetical protein Agabi119p4_8275 [Agaricus bisporus var. burnettii]|uniref:Uncharacterized protein n=1 Tax=Agaricus bisporus var. burnettii TaxID=192524 RepID=A0A8H7EYA0_AGABI|nr:hypothetical protein Agabi119p4_8275 [Agaricus bisporus var. burnettii]
MSSTGWMPKYTPIWAPPRQILSKPNSKMSDATLLQDSVVVSNFGQSYVVVPPPSSYEPGTMLNYQSPEARFEGRIGLEVEVARDR